jgi:hypothetical protein
VVPLTVHKPPGSAAGSNAPAASLGGITCQQEHDDDVPPFFNSADTNLLVLEISAIFHPDVAQQPESRAREHMHARQ